MATSKLLSYANVLMKQRFLLQKQVRLCSSEKKCELFSKTCRPKKSTNEENDKKSLDLTGEKDIFECPKPDSKCTENMVAAETAEGSPEEQEKSKESKEVALAPDQEDSEIVVQEEHEEEAYDPKVIIIGAGLAGLTAANRLVTTDVHNVTILEASERAGGRIQSSLFGDTIINLGGMFGDDKDGIPEACSIENPVIFHADQLGLVRCRDKIPLVLSIVTECDGKPLPLAASFLAITKMQKILAVADSLKTSSPYNDQGRTDSYIGLRMMQELKMMGDELKIPGARVMAALAILFTGNSYITTEHGEPTINVPGSNIKVPLGCSGVISPLLDRVSNHIQFSKEVNNISWGAISGLNGQRVIVRTKDGSEYNGDFVIFTPSLGVLKKQHETIFCPLLPSSTVKAMDDVVFENATRIFLFYSTPIRVWSPQKINWKLTDENTKSYNGPLGALREIKELSGSEKVLSVLMAGNGATSVEMTSKRALADELTLYMTKKLGECIPAPNDVIVTNWNSNKFYLGSRTLRGCDKLGESLPSCGSSNPPVLFFAGEATGGPNMSGIRAAFVSGMRAANKVLSYIPGDKESTSATDACFQLQSSLST